MQATKTQIRITPFQEKVYEALCRVPKGRVTTYKYLAKAVGCGSTQAIGQAMKHNPFAPEVPCHRVIKSDFNIGGYSGAIEGTLIEKKLKLLKSEGVEFDSSGQLIDTKLIYDFEETGKALEPIVASFLDSYAFKKT